MSYSLQRVPGDFGLSALFTLPAIFTAHVAGVKEAGGVSFAISLLTTSAAIFDPIDLIFLPKASQMIGTMNFRLLKLYIRKILKFTFLLTLSGVLFFEIFADEIISLYLGKSFSDLVLITRIIFFGSLFYNIYVSMRSIIDAYYVKSINTLNVLLSLLLFLLLTIVVSLFVKNYICIVLSFNLALFFLCCLTLLQIRNLIKKIEIYET